jgi:Fe2+ transport system protein B
VLLLLLLLLHHQHCCPWIYCSSRLPVRVLLLQMLAQQRQAALHCCGCYGCWLAALLMHCH